MHPINIIASALRKQKKSLPELPCTPVLGVCAVTGDMDMCVPKKTTLKKDFTNIDLLKAPDSDLVSSDVYHVFNYGYKTAEDKKIEKRPERMSSWFCDGENFEELDRKGIRDKVFSHDMPKIWTAYATTSYKKHGSLRAKINTDGHRVWLFEMALVDLSDIVKTLLWWEILNKNLRIGIGRSVIQTLDCPSFLIKKIGIKAWFEFEQWARPKYQSALYSFLCYLLPSQDELKNERFTVSENEQN